MRYIDEFRDSSLAVTLAAAIAAEIRPDRRYRFMEFCGGHTHAISRWGLEDLLPAAIELIHGPGCPVCVLPLGRIEAALWLARRPEVTLCTYADMMRVPGAGGASLFSARAEGADVRMVYSVDDALAIARAEPDRQVVFLAIGFETTTPATAMALKTARAEGLANFTVHCNHVLTPPAIARILEAPEIRGMEPIRLDGFIGPAHVSTVIGSKPYEYFAREFHKPVVIAGFEPLDVLQAVRMLVAQVNERRAFVENEYARAVAPEGNAKAKKVVAECFELRKSFEWRGLGAIPYSALRIKEPFAAWDAERRWTVPEATLPDPKSCDCAAILRGVRKPAECKLFGTACTPETPIGSCMVSSEGACAAHWTYGRFRDRPALPASGETV